MRLHILTALLALFVSACATRSNTASKAQDDQKAADHFSFLDGPARFR